jgi:hypothetical protein
LNINFNSKSMLISKLTGTYPFARKSTLFVNISRAFIATDKFE